MMISLLLAAALLTPSDAAYEAIKAKDGAERAELFQDAVEQNIRPELRDRLAPIVASIRYVENGKRYYYGIIHKRCRPGYRNQAGWCAATVQAQWDRWKKAGAKGEFLVSLSKRYCPVGADNDPNGLNKNWLPNLRKRLKRIIK